LHLTDQLSDRLFIWTKNYAKWSRTLWFRGVCGKSNEPKKKSYEKLQAPVVPNGTERETTGAKPKKTLPSSACVHLKLVAIWWKKNMLLLQLLLFFERGLRNLAQILLGLLPPVV
jgi:hypothetical protein